MNKDKISSTLKEIISKVLQTMTSTEVQFGETYPATINETWGDITGIIGLGGENISGNLIISFSESSIVAMVSRMFGEEFNSLVPDVVDAVGEITNIVAGGLKKEFGSLGYQVGMATPILILGKKVGLRQLCGEPTLVLPCSTQNGNFTVELNFSVK